MTNIGDIEAFQSLLNQLQQTQNNLNYLRDYLISQLEPHATTNLDDKTFKELIDTINDINATETQNENNTKPQNEPSITNAENTSDYILKLYQKIYYYNELLSYYLILKSVPEEKVKAQNTLEGLISLISLIESKKNSTISISNINEVYFYSKNILHYTLQDDNKKSITEGTITLKINDVEYCSINVGEELSFIQDFYSNEPVFLEIIYSGTDKYTSSQTSTSINVLSSDIRLDLFVSNIDTYSSYYGDRNNGYVDDMFNITIKAYNIQGDSLPNIPLSIGLNSFGESTNKLSLSDNNYMNAYTDDTGTCIINCPITTVKKDENNKLQKQVIKIESNYENTQALNKATNEHEVMIYYNPLYQTDDTYKAYYDSKGVYQYEISRVNIYTGKKNDNLYDGQDIKVSFDGMPSQTIRITNGKAIINLQSLNTGTHTLIWNLNGTKKKTTITILSNFTLPEKNTFFYPETPDICYKPNSDVILNSYYYDDNKQIQTIDINKNISTDTNGVLSYIKQYNNFHNYILNLIANSNGIDEPISYNYQILKPFSIKQKAYNEKIKITYDIHIYDIENYSLGDCNDTNKDIIKLFNENGENIVYLCSITDEYVNNEYYTIHITIPSKHKTYGNNSLIVNFNTYSESIDFVLTENIITFIADIILDETSGNLYITSEEGNPLEQELIYQITINDDGDIQKDTKNIEDINDTIVDIDINNNGDIIYTHYGEN